MQEKGGSYQGRKKKKRYFKGNFSERGVMEKEETKVEEARKGMYSDQVDLNKKR